jgi:hypothetical protein
MIEIRINRRAERAVIRRELRNHCTVGNELELIKLAHNVISNVTIKFIGRHAYAKRKLYDSWPTIASNFLNNHLKVDKMHYDHPLAKTICNIFQRKYTEMLDIAKAFMQFYKSMDVKYSRLLGAWLLYYLPRKNQLELHNWFGFYQNEALRLGLDYCFGKHVWHTYEERQGDVIIAICDILSKVTSETNAGAVRLKIDTLTHQTDRIVVNDDNSNAVVNDDEDSADDDDDEDSADDDDSIDDDDDAENTSDYENYEIVPSKKVKSQSQMEKTSAELTNFAADNFSPELYQTVIQGVETGDSIVETSNDSSMSIDIDDIKNEIYAAINAIILNEPLSEQQLSMINLIDVPTTAEKYYECLQSICSSNYKQYLQQINAAAYQEIRTVIDGC